jgi:hypothetical protein
MIPTECWKCTDGFYAFNCTFIFIFGVAFVFVFIFSISKVFIFISGLFILRVIFAGSFRSGRTDTHHFCLLLSIYALGSIESDFLCFFGFISILIFFKFTFCLSIAIKLIFNIFLDKFSYLILKPYLLSDINAFSFWSLSQLIHLKILWILIYCFC